MISRRLAAHAAALALMAAAAVASGPAAAADPIKVGLVVPVTGPFAYMGRQVEAGASLYLSEHGDTVAGRKVEIVVKDDAGVPATTKRLAQELVLNDKVTVLAGFGLTPQAFAAAPIATQSKTPMVVMQAATSSVTEKSPYIVRTSMTLPQVTVGVADWAANNKIRKVVSLVSDFAPGVDAETTFKEQFVAKGGQVVEALRMPMITNDFSPYLQRARDANPDAIFLFLPAGDSAAIFMKQYAERGLDKAGIKLIGTGDIVDDDVLGQMGDVALGTITSHHYSAAHPSALNKKFVDGIEKANKGMRPSFMAVGGYDGMRVIMEGLKATNGAGGDALVNAMKGQQFESPRGPVLIDPQTRDIVQDVYIRKVERVGGKLYNVEFDVQKAVKDPGKAK
ncbi:amino acid/amide ABC transporter substrate-binding protein, HAAT family [Variovorax sp. HW608]|uniref:ABC transporter substrate-binding protein n=1 Tax=Variovorax sp. HW608 TaxID=1034889 RepID=UPI00081FF0F0|nr:ABC transporter substrate-binding protein [Variovorax sp. HW608]SCK11713.1 amino acid/amide ABC transporter substrate-binding protein, HAAT family [Variovorax sp. HW608]